MSLKKLYVAKSMKDLESATELKQNIKTRPTNLLASSADKLFKEAQVKHIDKDEEAAYVQYMRFLELVLLLKKRPDFKKVENRSLLLEQANIAISKAENLKDSLKKRYSILEKAASKENEKNILTAVKSGQSYASLSGVPSENINDKEKLFISSSELYSLIISDKSSIIIMDTRPAKDFAESHIKYHASISVPEEILKPGLTVAKLESTLPRESLSHWFKHAEVDQVILVDWDLENEITQNVCLHLLRSVMCQNCSLKKAPLILKGGFKGWIKKYPMLATQVLNLDQLNDSKVNSVTSDTSDKEKLSISSSELHSLITSGESIIIIMDTRPTIDFEESHIKYSGCISVPQEVLKPGLTAAKLECSLPKESLVQWYKRKDADFIILVDWDSKDETTQNIYLNSLKLAMSKWDQSCVLKKSPMVLRGGYQDFMRKYPMCTTQALNFDLMTNLKLSPVVTDLSDIEYPNLDETVNNEVQILNEKNSSDMLFKKCHTPDFIINGISPTSSYNARTSVSAPTFDRKSKPSNTVNKFSNPEVKSNKTFSPVNNKRTEISMSDKKLPPPVDRKSKSVIFKSVNDETDFNRNAKDPVLTSFNKEQSLVKESVDIANQKLKNEEEFEKLCLRKELEAEESKRIEIQKQEEKLLQKIKLLEIQSAEKEAELKKVKDENCKIRKILDDQVDKEYKLEKEKEIRDALKKQTELRESVEKMREERKRKEAENQKKKEIHLLPSRDISSANPVLRRADTNPASSANPSEYTMPLSKQILSGDSSGRGLVRSHSSPNIAQMMNEEEECAQQKIPSIDRSLKPRVVNVTSPLSEINRARQRNLNPLYGNCPVRPATGLRNLGNTCFMNSVIQCLSNTIPLADYINSNQYVEHINRENKQGTGGELVEEFAAVIKALWMGQYKSFYPRDFKNTVSKCLAVCIGNEQQDSHEFLVVMMEKLHADLSKKSYKNVPKLDPNCNENTFWQHHKNYSSSKISDIFDGLLKSTLTCLSCRKTSDSFEIFSCLSLPIMTSKCTLKECFQHFLRAEKISGEAAWDCPRCKQKKEAEKRLRICQTPEVLIIQLKRFSYEGLWRRKLQTHVDFDFNMEVPYETNAREGYRLYSLYGIVNHYGTLEGGHYTAYCKTNTGKWFKYDDHEVSEISSSDIKTSAAYLLFYIATDFQSRL